MKRYISYSVILAILLSTALVVFNRCSVGNTTRVTIHLKTHEISNTRGKTSIFDKISLLLFKPVYAMAGWSSTWDSLQLVVSGPGMETITTDIPPLATSYTIEVLSGADREFTIYSYTSANNVPKNYGGRTVLTLNPGEESTINIVMRPMTRITNQYTSTSTITIVWEDTGSYDVGYNVYRSTNPDGPYINIGNTINSTYNDYPVTYNVMYYYKVSVLTTTGEGIPCDYISQLGPP